MIKKINAYRLYKWRYFIAYCSLAVFYFSLIAMTFWYAPAGLRQAEVDQVSQLRFATMLSGESIIELPYNLLQATSLKLFGLSWLGIKLPSLLIGSITVSGFFWLILRWINLKTALISTILAISTSQFMIIIQDGTPGIMFIFWQVMLMILLTQLSRYTPDAQQLKSTKKPARLALILPLLGIVIGLSLYTPMMIFLPALLLGLLFYHPKPRLFAKQFSLRLLMPGIVGFGLIISPLILQIITKPTLLKSIISLQAAPTNPLQPLIDIFDFWTNTPHFLVQPVFSLGALILALIGGISLAQQYFSVRSTAVFFLMIINLLLSGLLAHSSAITLWLPVAMLIAYGIHSLTVSWMTIFPVNPYPRFFGSFTLSLMTIVLCLASVDSLFKKYAYAPNLAQNFKQDLTIVTTFLQKNPKHTLIVANQDELNFYQRLRIDHLKIEILNENITHESRILTRQAFKQSSKLMPSFALTDSHSQDFERFYVYQKNQN